MITTELHAFLRSRRSIRRFKPDPVPDSVIENLLLTATFAPSAHHRQPWRFCVVKDPSARAKLANAMASDFERDLTRDGISPDKIQSQIKRSKDRINTAPAVILLCLDMSEMDVYPDKKRRQAEFRMTVQSAANAGMQLLLAAHAEGLGSVWVCSPLFAQESIQQAMALPEAWEPQALYFLGYPTDVPKPRERKTTAEITILR